MKIAIIDIGSNSVRLMLCKNNKKPEAILKRTITTRLGDGLSITGSLKNENIKQTVDAVLAFRKEALNLGAKKIYAFATESVRKAANRDALLIMLKSQNIDVDVLLPEEEAKCAYIGATKNIKDVKDKQIAVLDIGGGSTEFAYGINGEIEFSCSEAIGTRRMKDLCSNEKGKLDKYINENIHKYKNSLIIDEFIAIGGTATTVASTLQGLNKYNSKLIDGYIINKSDLYDLLCKMFSMTEDQIRELKGMYKERADVILGGVYLLYRMMEHFRTPRIKVSDSDNMEGYAILKAKG